MNEREKSFQSAVVRMAQAFTRAEIDGAAQAAREHLARYPRDETRDLWHGWGSQLVWLEQREAEARALGLTVAEQDDREALLRGSYAPIDTITDPEASVKLAAVIERLERWLASHPTDPSASRRLHALHEERAFAEAIAAPTSEVPVTSGKT
jgi:hypothetical protein